MNVQQTKWGFLFLLALIWGSSFILIKKGLIGLDPFQLGSLRIIFSAVFLLIVGFKSLASIKLQQWKYVALTSLFGTFIPAYFFAIAETKVSSSICSILNSLTPLNTLIIGAIAFGLNFKRSQIFGILIGLIGTAILIFTRGQDTISQDNTYSIFVLVASVCYAINVNLLKKYLSDMSPLSISTGNFVVMLLPAIVILSLTDFNIRIHNDETLHAIWFIAILGVVGTGIANILFFKLIQISSPVFAASVTYLIPIIAFMWGMLDNERLAPMQFFGAFIVLIGVYLANKK